MKTTTTILEKLGYVCLAVAFLFVTTGIAGVWLKGGYCAVQQYFNPDIVDAIVLFIPFIPGIVIMIPAFLRRNRVEKETKEPVRIGLNHCCNSHETGFQYLHNRKSPCEGPRND